jgi:hypothetical protein
LKRSDDELYHAKEGGRNRVYFAGVGKIEPATPEAAAPEKPEDTIKKIV